MTQQSPPLWNQPYPGQQPGAHPFAKRFETLGNVSLGLGIGELLYCLWRLVSPLLSQAMVGAQRGMLAGTKSAGRMVGINDAAQAFMAKIQLWEALRTLPFLVVTAFLIWIALRIRKGDAKALAVAKLWSLGALGAVAVSVVIQIVVTVPATMEYQRAIVDLLPTMPSGSSAPFDVKKMTSSITIISTVIGLFFGTVILSAWPIALFFWASKLQRDSAAQASAYGG
jgi:hypothetical protein